MPPKSPFLWKSFSSIVAEQRTKEQHETTSELLERPSKLQKTDLNTSVKIASIDDAKAAVNSFYERHQSEDHIFLDLATYKKYQTSLSADVYLGYNFLCNNRMFKT